VGGGARRERLRRALEHPAHRRRLVERRLVERRRPARPLPRADPRRRDDRADARPAVAEGDDPEPAALGALAEDDDLDVALLPAGVAPGVRVLREEGGAIEVGDAIDGAVAARQERVAT